MSSLTTTQGGNASPGLADLTRYEAGYVKLFGKVADHVRNRWAVTTKYDRSKVAGLLEEIRVEAIHNNPLGVKVQQLVHFGQLLTLGRKEGAEHHAKAALAAGATVEELIGVAETSLLTSGAAAYGLGLEVAGGLGATRSN